MWWSESGAPMHSNPTWTFWGYIDPFQDPSALLRMVPHHQCHSHSFSPLQAPLPPAKTYIKANFLWKSLVLITLISWSSLQSSSKFLPYIHSFVQILCWLIQFISHFMGSLISPVGWWQCDEGRSAWATQQLHKLAQITWALWDLVSPFGN